MNKTSPHSSAILADNLNANLKPPGSSNKSNGSWRTLSGSIKNGPLRADRRSTVGFDRMFSMFDQLGGVEGSAPGYPPYNIERTGENAYRISGPVTRQPFGG
jgi:hypothetical protein